MCLNVCRNVQVSNASFHRSLSQPVGMDMSGLSSAGWNAVGGSKAPIVSGNNLGGNGFGPSSSVGPGTSMWRGTSGVPLNAGNILLIVVKFDQFFVCRLTHSANLPLIV